MSRKYGVSMLNAEGKRIAAHVGLRAMSVVASSVQVTNRMIVEWTREATEMEAERKSARTKDPVQP